MRRWQGWRESKPKVSSFSRLCFLKRINECLDTMWNNSWVFLAELCRAIHLIETEKKEREKVRKHVFFNYYFLQIMWCLLTVGLAVPKEFQPSLFSQHYQHVNDWQVPWWSCRWRPHSWPGTELLPTFQGGHPAPLPTKELTLPGNVKKQ